MIGIGLMETESVLEIPADSRVPTKQSVCLVCGRDGVLAGVREKTSMRAQVGVDRPDQEAVFDVGAPHSTLVDQQLDRYLILG
jgi:hypothetical protein